MNKVTMTREATQKLLGTLYSVFPPSVGDESKSGAFDATSISLRAPAMPALMSALAPFEPQVISRGTILANGYLSKGTTTRIRRWLDECPYDYELPFGGWVLIRDSWGWCFVRSTSGNVMPISWKKAQRWLT
jgi:hypothetical protein